jgi:hypothetical protein
MESAAAAAVRKTLKGSLSFSSSLRPEEGGMMIGEQEGSTVDEISIFDAHNYFNESSSRVSCNINVNVVNLKRNSERLDPTRFSWVDNGYTNVRNYRATPTASSEASWNSRSGLLSNPPGAIPLSVHKGEKKMKGSGRWLFGRKCPCSGRKSVRVAEPKRQSESVVEKVDDSGKAVISYKSLLPADHHTTTTTAFSFPILNPSSSSSTSSPLKVLQVLKGGGVSIRNIEESDPARHSLEVFRPSSHVHEAVSNIPKSRMVDDNDEVASNASSDLFEIESFSTQTSSYPTTYGGREYSVDSCDTRLGGVSPMALTPTSSTSNHHIYEPSECSIDWSVTTADDDPNPMVMQGPEKSKRRPSSSSSPLSGNGLLSSCRCEKAVSVGPNPKKWGSEEYKPTLRHVGSRPPIPYKPPSHSQSPRARLSLPFAT